MYKFISKEIFESPTSAFRYSITLVGTSLEEDYW